MALGVLSVVTTTVTICISVPTTAQTGTDCCCLLSPKTVVVRELKHKHRVGERDERIESSSGKKEKERKK